MIFGDLLNGLPGGSSDGDGVSTASRLVLGSLGSKLPGPFGAYLTTILTSDLSGLEQQRWELDVPDGAVGAYLVDGRYVVDYGTYLDFTQGGPLYQSGTHYGQADQAEVLSLSAPTDRILIADNSAQAPAPRYPGLEAEADMFVKAFDIRPGPEISIDTSAPAHNQQSVPPVPAGGQPGTDVLQTVTVHGAARQSQPSPSPGQDEMPTVWVRGTRPATPITSPPESKAGAPEQAASIKPEQSLFPTQRMITGAFGFIGPTFETHGFGREFETEVLFLGGYERSRHSHDGGWFLGSLIEGGTADRFIGYESLYFPGSRRVEKEKSVYRDRALISFGAAKFGVGAYSNVRDPRLVGFYGYIDAFNFVGGGGVSFDLGEDLEAQLSRSLAWAGVKLTVMREDTLAPGVEKEIWDRTADYSVRAIIFDAPFRIIGLFGGHPSSLAEWADSHIASQNAKLANSDAGVRITKSWSGDDLGHVYDAAARRIYALVSTAGEGFSNFSSSSAKRLAPQAFWWRNL